MVCRARVGSGFIVAAAMMGMGVQGCSDGAEGEPRVVVQALIEGLGTPELASLQLIGATDWQATGRRPLEMIILIDGQVAGWELGGEPVLAFEGSAVGFSYASGTRRIQLADGDGVVWDFGEQTLAADRVTTLAYFGSPDDPRVMALADLDDVPAGHAAARVVNLDERRAPIDALLCPEGAESYDTCEVVAEGLAYGEAWTGVVPIADHQVVAWERARPAGYPLERFVGADPYPVGHRLCLADVLRSTTTLIPVRFETPESAPECPFCTTAWMFGAGRAPGDCAW